MSAIDRVVRRRSSKACDQCRKAKCKCERSQLDSELCKNCLLLGTECTFLGPSRKRGPAKGYLSELELKLHQYEALLGSILASPDNRAQSLISDLSKDPLASDILARVDNSPFGTKGRKPRQISPDDASGSRGSSLSRRQDSTFPGTTPEWQDHLTDRISANGSSGFATHSRSASGQSARRGHVPAPLDLLSFPYPEDVKPQVSAFPSPQTTSFAPDQHSPRQRRRLDSSPHPRSHLWASSNSGSHSDQNSDASSDEEEFADELGQLSLDEHKQVRYHGKASGLHLLSHSVRDDNRNQNGIWNFPPARIWPPVHDNVTKLEEPLTSLPPRAHQEHLVQLFFTYVHPVLPILTKQQFMNSFNQGSTAEDDILLLSIFAVGARYSDRDTPLPSEGHMWSAGDEYFKQARVLLLTTGLASSRSTCQALILLGYREIGIGAMARAWLYIGMAIRMAQDLGLHRSVSKLQTNASVLFTPEEQEMRNRTWYSLVIMDKYVSTYIGRPLSISESDFDTQLPVPNEAEEFEIWQDSKSSAADAQDRKTGVYSMAPRPYRTISCFKASISLASILSEIVQTLYSIRPTVRSRHTHASILERRLEQWYLGLETDLAFDHAKKAYVPPPHVLTLHMQYWSSVLLVHRASIRCGSFNPESPRDTEFNLVDQKSKSFDMSAMAATQISNLVSVFMENFDFNRCPAFLSYYIFSSSITHVTTLSSLPHDLQARMGLRENMRALKAMELLWPSAGRAWELLHSCSNIHLGEAELVHLHKHTERHKRAADVALDDDEGETNHQFNRAVHTSQSFDPPLDFPSTAPSRSSTFFPGYSQWPTESHYTYHLQPNPSFSTRQPGSTQFWHECVPSGDPFSDSPLLTSPYYGLPAASAAVHSLVTTQNQNAAPAYINNDYSHYDSTIQ